MKEHAQKNLNNTKIILSKHFKKKNKSEEVNVEKSEQETFFIVKEKKISHF